MATADLAAEPIPERSDTTKAVRNVFNRHLAHEGIMLDRMQRQLANSEKLQRFAATGNTDDLPKPGEDDEMGVNIGNEYHLHQIMQPTEPAKPTNNIAQAAASKLWPFVLGAVMASGSTGLGWLLHSWTADKPAATTAVDTDTITEMTFP